MVIKNGILSKMRRLLSGSLHILQEMLLRIRTTSNRLRTENQELKTETKELKKELGKMKDLFNSEQLEVLRHHFPNISKAMEEGKDLLKQITRSRGFGMGM